MKLTDFPVGLLDGRAQAFGACCATAGKATVDTAMAISSNTKLFTVLGIELTTQDDADDSLSGHGY